MLAAGGATPAAVGAGGSDGSWNVAHLAALRIPMLQGLCRTSSWAQWNDSDDGTSPLDVATQVAVPADKRLALVFSAYPTKHARIGNAVGLDTPASAVALLRAMREAGYRIGDVPSVDAQDGDALVHALIERGGQVPDWLTEGQLTGTRSGCRRPTTEPGSRPCPRPSPTRW